jgi:hypothetical protein
MVRLAFYMYDIVRFYSARSIQNLQRTCVWGMDYTFPILLACFPKDESRLIKSPVCLPACVCVFVSH